MNRSYNSYGELAENAQYSEGTPQVRLFDSGTDNAGVTAATAVSGGGDNPHRIPQWHKKLADRVANIERTMVTKEGLKAELGKVNQSIVELKNLITGGQNPPGQNGASPQNPVPKSPAPANPQQNPPAGGQSDTGRSW